MQKLNIVSNFQQGASLFSDVYTVYFQLKNFGSHQTRQVDTWPIVEPSSKQPRITDLIPEAVIFHASTATRMWVSCFPKVLPACQCCASLKKPLSRSSGVCFVYCFVSQLSQLQGHLGQQSCGCRVLAGEYESGANTHIRRWIPVSSNLERSSVWKPLVATCVATWGLKFERAHLQHQRHNPPKDDTSYYLAL